MAITVFKDSSYSLSTLREEIDRGEIALPDIQRPFVWKPAKVRDLFDSMYRGFPVGNLLFPPGTSKTTGNTPSVRPEPVSAASRSADHLKSAHLTANTIPGSRCACLLCN